MIDVNETYELLTPDVRGNPHPVYARMRLEAPVHLSHHFELNGHPWIFTRYQDCVNLLKDPRFTKDQTRKSDFDMTRIDIESQSALAINRHMLTVDPPDHTRLRDLVHKAFTPRMIRELNGRIQEITDDLINAAQPRGEMDFIADFAVPIPVTVIAELLGVPTSDQAKFREWSQIIVKGGSQGSNREKTATAVLEFIMYFHNLFEERRAEPQDDLISGLLQVEQDGDKLDSQELISMVFLLLVAGHETTVNLIGNGTLALLNNPDQMRKLRANPSLIHSAVEEMLRYDGPIGISTMRWTLEDMEMYGQLIPANSLVVASLLAANRDPEVFPNPDVFDITREPNRHIAFGHGIHYCLGAPLARLEGSIAINTLLRRLPHLELTVHPDQLEWHETLLLHGMTAMPVRF